MTYCIKSRVNVWHKWWLRLRVATDIFKCCNEPGFWDLKGWVVESATVLVGIAWQKCSFFLRCFGLLVSLTRRISPGTLSAMVGVGHISSAYRHSLRGSMASIPSGWKSLGNVTSMCNPGQIAVDGLEKRVPVCGEHDTETWCPGLYKCYSW